ncbi:futalosine hydrolase [Pedobacter sp. CG_S7]|uniref:futalosine hydrolase n=1 Tax=Pedobacter sp. CG_S7 TaxID=3143930 RepID=UPI0033917B04
MKILVVAATIPEIAAVYTHFNLPPAAFLQSPNFDLLITGVGMTATAYTLGKHLSADYNLVLNLGIAGSFDYSIPLGSVLNVISDEFAELGAENKDSFISIDELGFGKSKFENNFSNEIYCLNQLPKVNGITVNKVHGNKKHIHEVKARLNPKLESMEGAAVFYACEQAGIPCLQVRGISNYVEERNKETWKIELAIKNLNDWAIEFLTNA